MSAGVGTIVYEALEQAGERYLKGASPELHQLFLFFIGATDEVRCYDGSVTYWNRVQALLDGFFASEQRAEIYARLLRQPKLSRCPEFRDFWATALAERTMGAMIQDIALAAAVAGGGSLRIERHLPTSRS